jgi:hypothetical protein
MRALAGSPSHRAGSQVHGVHLSPAPAIQIKIHIVSLDRLQFAFDATRREKHDFRQ